MLQQQTDPNPDEPASQSPVATPRLERAQSFKISFIIVFMIVYALSIIAGVVVLLNQIDFSSPAADLNKVLIMGIPAPIWVWAVVGSVTAMLLRADSFRFLNRDEALRLLLLWPIVGSVMGLMTYLITAGIIVFAGTSPQSPAISWVVAFVGSFSGTYIVYVVLPTMPSAVAKRKSSPIEIVTRVREWRAHFKFWRYFYFWVGTIGAIVSALAAIQEKPYLSHSCGVLRSLGIQ